MILGFACLFACQQSEPSVSIEDAAPVKAPPKAEVQHEADSGMAQTTSTAVSKVKLEPMPNPDASVSHPDARIASTPKKPKPARPGPFDLPPWLLPKSESCKERTDFTRKAYARALTFAENQSCRSSSDCKPVLNVPNCVLKTHCRKSAYTSVPKYYARKLKKLDRRLSEKVCRIKTHSCARPKNYKCAAPRLSAYCIKGRCSLSGRGRSSDGSIRLGPLYPKSETVSRAMTRFSRLILDRCARKIKGPAKVQGNRIVLELFLEDGRAKQVSLASPTKDEVIAKCLMQGLSRRFRYPRSEFESGRFRQTFHLGKR